VAIAKALILSQQKEIEQLTDMATELPSLREQIGRALRNSSKPASGDSAGFKNLRISP
jgi:hypothetical protein